MVGGISLTLASMKPVTMTPLIAAARVGSQFVWSGLSCGGWALVGLFVQKQAIQFADHVPCAQRDPWAPQRPTFWASPIVFDVPSRIDEISRLLFQLEPGVPNT